MNGLPKDVASILEYLAMMAAGYDNHLKWNEEAKLKADLMNTPERWRGVAVGDVGTRCGALGMREDDIDLITDLIRRAQAGRRLIAEKSYRSFRFPSAD